MTILKWGDYVHQPDEIGVKIEQQALFDQFGRRIGMFHTWHILGWIKSTSQSDLNTKLAALETAYDTDNKDLGLYLNDGTTPTQHVLANSATFGGTHVVGFGYATGPWKMGLEYANRRTFWIIIRGEVRIGDGLYQYKETVRYKGVGGSKWRFIPQMVGLAEKQTLQTASSFFVIQQGRAVGFNAYPTPPAAISPSDVHFEHTEFDYDTPEQMRVGGSKLYPVEWTYVMEGNSALPGVPSPPTISPF